MAKKAMKAEPDRWGGAGMATAGVVLGAINIGLGVVVAVIYVIIAVVAVASH